MNNGMRQITSRVEILRNGVRYGDMTYSEPPQISMSSIAEICLSMRGTFAASSSMDVLTDILRPVLVIDGVDHPLGQYVVGTRTEKGKGGACLWDIEAYDRSLVCKQTKTETRHFIAAGTGYLTAIHALLLACGVKMLLESPNSDTLTTDREDWDIGTPHLTIINGLLSEINFYPLWFDLNGYARLTKKEAALALPADHVYRSGELSILRPDVSGTLDIYDAPNVFIALLSNAEQEPMTATAVNDNPSSALSTICRGRRIVKTVKVDNIASAEALQTYADGLRNASMLSTETIEFATGLSPTHGVRDIVELHHPDMEGLFLETDWSMTLQAGEVMTHKARRVIYL